MNEAIHYEILAGNFFMKAIVRCLINSKISLLYELFQILQIILSYLFLGIGDLL